MARYNGHKSVETTATVTEADSAFGVQRIVHLTNDGGVDIIFNFDGATTAPNAFTLKPNESIEGEEYVVKRLHYKTNSGQAEFRALGLS